MQENCQHVADDNHNGLQLCTSVFWTTLDRVAYRDINTCLIEVVYVTSLEELALHLIEPSGKCVTEVKYRSAKENSSRKKRKNQGDEGCAFLSVAARFNNICW